MSDLVQLFTQGLIERGMPPHVAQAFVMNGMDESGLNPAINERAPVVPGSRGGFGVMQWTGPRRRALEGFAAERGVNVADPNLQMDYLMYELQGPEKAAASRIFAAPDTPQAASAVLNYFLRPAEEHRARREAKYTGSPQLSFGSAVPQGAGVSLADMFGPMAGAPFSLGERIAPQQPQRFAAADTPAQQRGVSDQVRRMGLADLIRY